MLCISHLRAAVSWVWGHSIPFNSINLPIPHMAVGARPVRPGAGARGDGRRRVPQVCVLFGCYYWLVWSAGLFVLECIYVCGLELQTKKDMYCFGAFCF